MTYYGLLYAEKCIKDPPKKLLDYRSVELPELPCI